MSGSLAVFYAPKSAACNRELERKFDAVVHGEERRRAVDAEREARFEKSTRTLLRIDPRINEPPIEPHPP